MERSGLGRRRTRLDRFDRLRTRIRRRPVGGQRIGDRGGDRQQGDQQPGEDGAQSDDAELLHVVGILDNESISGLLLICAAQAERVCDVIR